MAKFEHCDYGPLRLRGLLRARLDHQERIVAWGPVMQEPQTHSALAAFALSIVPIVGIVLGPAVSRTNHALLIVTDRRLLLVKSNTAGPLPDGRGVLLDVPIETVEVDIRSHGAAELVTARPARRRRLRTPGGRRQIARSRLWRSLVLLSEQEPPDFEESEGEAASRAARDPRASLPLDPRTDAA